MTLMTDRWIKEQCEKHDMISPFVDKQKKDKTLSYGLSSYGYDARLAPEFKIFTNANPDLLVDPKHFNVACVEEKEGEYCIIPPHGFLLGRTVEHFKIPENVFSICIGKSTYARCGIIVNVTPMEPGSDGYVVLELSNTTPLPVKVYANEGICQFIFFSSVEAPMVNYKSKGGKYMHQKTIVFPHL